MQKPLTHLLALLFATTPVYAQPERPEPNPPPPQAPSDTEPTAEALPPPAPAPMPDVPPAPVALAPAAPAATTPVSLAPEPVPPPLPKKLSVAKDGFFQPSFLLQVWLHGTRQSSETQTTFRLRRSEIKIKGDIIDDLLSYALMFDPAKVLEFEDEDLEVEGQTPAPATPGSVEAAQPQSNVSVLQDAYATFESEFADVGFGQFKNPLSWEGFNSASQLLFPERATAARFYGDERDIGLRVSKKLGDYVYYNLGVYNGPGLNRRDNNNQKDIALRVELYPIEGVMLGGVGYTSVGEREEPTSKDRLEADLRIELGDALLQVEYLHGWDGPKGARVEGHGFYAAAGYTFFDQLQPAVRVGALDADIDQDLGAGKGDELWHYEAVVNYFVQGKQAKVALAYGFFDYDDWAARGELTLLGQASF